MPLFRSSQTASRSTAPEDNQRSPWRSVARGLPGNLTQPKLLSLALLLFTLVTGIFIGTVLNTGVKAAHQAPISSAPDATPLSIPRAVPIANEFTKLTKRVEPSVVYIESDYLAETGKNDRPPARGPK